MIIRMIIIGVPSGTKWRSVGFYLANRTGQWEKVGLNENELGYQFDVATERQERLVIVMVTP